MNLQAEEMQMERCYLRRVALLAVFLIAIALILIPLSGNAEPVFHAAADGARVVLHSDKCALPEVQNLPFRAQWIENGKTFEGCWSPPHPQVGVVLAYFTDKTVVGLPAQIFKKLVGV